MNLRRWTVAACSAIALFCFTSIASAAPSGHLDVANCSGGGVTVSATVIDWLPAGGGNGCIQTGTGTSVTYTTGTLGVGVTGTILDLVLGGPSTVPDFMTFAGNPNLHFDLTGLGPGTGNSNCAGATAPGSSCSPNNGPFILVNTGNGGTSVTLSASGIARDLSGVNTPWSGAFTTQISNMTPAQINTVISQGGSITSTESGDFSLTVVPEPGTISMALIGGGLIAVAMRRKSARK